MVTGAFGYSGRYIAERLLRAGRRVRTLTGSPDRAHPFGDRVEVHPFNFDHPERLAGSLEGARVLYNTYWVRFNHAGFRYSQAVDNTRALFAAARRAAVSRVVHVSITNPSEDSPLEYFRGKALLERELRESGLSHAILRPALFFGGEDILINNIAWALRHLPVFGVFGAGHYRLQPIHVHDFADLAVAQGVEREDRTIDAIGPETYRYRELVRELARILGVRRPVVSVPPRLGYAAGWLLGKLLGDVVITRDEVEGLMQGLLATGSEPAGRTKLSTWAREHAATLGRRYASELGRRRNRRVAYVDAK
ncbi:MAG TPA: NAD(P)H-binding protein [Candidatus Limnocylindria bacterium]|nr:NAD(P)H-binding protein [Candidatus Limnocylindria bacterium]